MRKPLVSRMTKAWLSTVTVQSLLLTAVVLGPLFTPISLATALKLNGTTPVPPTASGNGAASEDPTTVASFLQPDNSETTLNSQIDELTTFSSSSVAKRHSSIHTASTTADDGSLSQSRGGSPRYLKKSFLNSAESDSQSASKEKPQRNGTGATEEEEGGGQSTSLGITTAEQEGDADGDNALPNTTARDNDSGGGASVSTNSLGVDNDDGASLSLDKDDSDVYFSGGDDEDATNANANEGDSATTDDDLGGETATEDIFPEDNPINNNNSDESGLATTFASLLRSPNPTTIPQSFSAQLAMKLGRAPGTNRHGSRLGTRGLSSKTELNSIASPTPPTTTPPTTSKPNSSSADTVVEDNVASGSTSDGSVVVIARNTSDSSIKNNLNSNDTTNFDLNGSKFHSRSNLQTASNSSQQLPRTRPTTSSVINHSSNSNSNNNNHNNNLHNRIIKRKKLALGRGNATTGGSSLSSIYNNSILTSTSTSSSTIEVEVSTVSSSASTSSTETRVSTTPAIIAEDAATESNSLLNASQDESKNSTNSTTTELDDRKHENESSPAVTSGTSDNSQSHNSTIPVNPLESSEAGSSSSSSNSTSPLSSSRAILGFGPTSASSHGKVKRPKPIIIRDHDDSLYINNISENNAGSSAGSGHVASTTGRTNQAGLPDDETATSSDGVGVTGEDDTNKPVGSNALPTPPFKVRRVKINSRRASTTLRPSRRSDAATVSATTTLSPSSSSYIEPSTESSSSSSSSSSLTSSLGDADVNSLSGTKSLTAEAASGATDYSQLHSAIKPSISRNEESPYFSSRRVFKEEFGITHNSYGNGDDEDDNDQTVQSPDINSGRERELEATTEYFSFDNTTPSPYPIPMGVRSKQIEEEEESVVGDNDNDNEDDYGKSHVGRSSSEAENDNRYRDYYSEIRSASVEYGNSGKRGNLHIKSDADDKSPVTVTVTHTVVQPTPQITPTATMAEQDVVSLSKYSNNDSANKAYQEKQDDTTSGERVATPNFNPTPALPSSIFVNPSPTQTTLEAGQGPLDAGIISKSAHDFQITTSQYGGSSGGIRSHEYEDDQEGNDQKENNGVVGAPSTPQPTPVISTKGIKSVYFTRVEHPHFTSSSYEFTTSSMYSYTFPDHDSMHMMHHDDDEEDHHEDEHDATPYPNFDEEHPPSSRRNTPEMDHNGTTVYDSPTFNSSPAPPQNWDENSANLTKSSSSQVPIRTDQENIGISPTPSIDIDIYPPIEPETKVEDETDSTTTTAPSKSSQVPGSLEDNEISEEELRKHNNTMMVDSTTTMKPLGAVVNGKDKGEQGSSSPVDNDMEKDDDSLSKDKDSKPNVDSEYKGGSDNKGGASVPGIEPKVPGKEESTGSKTPFGTGEAFGIGSVHVPLMVQMDLDVANVGAFCSHLSGFKRMILMVYETQRNVKLNPAQIVIYTEPGCDLPKKIEETTSQNYNENYTDGHSSTNLVTTSKPGSSSSSSSSSPGGKILSTSKGTYPLTSPPPDGREGESKRSRSGKSLDSAKNSTGQSESSSESNKSSGGGGSGVGNKSQIELESAPQNKTLRIIRSRRSTKMATTAASTRNANFSNDTKTSLDNLYSTTENNSLLSVFFYVNDENGSYDQDLTSSFVRLWNDTSRLTNVTDDSNNESGVDGNGGGVGTPNEGNGDGSSFDTWMKRVKKVGMITASHLTSSTGSSDENSGIIVAITVASVVAVCLFLLGIGLLVMRHRQSQTKFAKRCTPVTLDDYSLDNISVYNSFRRKQRLRGSKRSYTNAAFDDHTAPTRPVNASALSSCISDVPSLENEFRAIPNVSATLDDIPNGAETKNRYANVIPMPDTRVLLTFLEDIPNSDYINANYVRGVNGEPKRYIITQGPLEETIIDFWRMVWEQQVRVVFMLTDFAEGGIAKCAEYYPRSETIDCSQLHGDFQITLEKRDISDHCITSYLVLKDMERNLRRDIVHFWYHSWPEKGVPASPKMTIDFLNRSRKFTKDPVPVVVHCSPGTGRSGTIVACDIAMKEYDTQNTVDIPRLVMKIRQDRAGAVQTKEQYLHIYSVLHNHASRIGGSHLESI